MFKEICFLLLFTGSATATHANGNGTRELRLYGTTQVTREQINSNYKGSASIAILYTYGFTLGAILAQDKILLPFPGDIGFGSAKVSGLILNYTTEVEDGEIYKVHTLPTAVPGRTLSTVTFGPLSPDSKGVVATLRPPGSLPPKPGTSECVVYTYGSNGLTDDPKNYVLGYLPLTIVNMSKCTPEYGPKDDKVYFCASAKSPSGTQPDCSYPDYFRVAMCPEDSFSKSYEAVAPTDEHKDGKIWCKKGRLWWWWWWCTEEEVSEPEWILTGLSATPSNDQHCNAESEFVMLFDYTNI